MTRLYHQFLNFLAEREREEHIRPEDQEARNKARARENAEGQHNKKVSELRNRTQNSSQPHRWGKGSDNSMDMKHDVLHHLEGKTHVKTNLNTGKTSVSYESHTSKQKLASHNAEIKKQQANMGSHVVVHEHSNRHYETTITPVNKDGSLDHRGAKLVTTDRLTGESHASNKYEGRRR